MPATSDTAGTGGDPGADAEPPPRLSLEVIHDDGDWSAFPDVETAIRRCAAGIETHGNLIAGSAQACVALSSADVVRRLNREYRQKDKPTNVLSFPALDAAPAGFAGGAQSLGDVILAAEVVLAEAAENGVPPLHHLQHLVVHGLLHLMGYDHETDAQAAIMEGLETDILQQLGIADPYSQDLA